VRALTLNDQRPDTAPKSQQGLVINTAPAMAIPNGKIRHIDWLMQCDHANLVIVNHTWIPKNLDIAIVMKHSVRLLMDIRRSPQPMTVANATIMPMPTPPKARWASYYNPTNQHVIDWWGWYGFDDTCSLETVYWRSVGATYCRVCRLCLSSSDASPTFHVE
jgi:hypothetical protein